MAKKIEFSAKLKSAINQVSQEVAADLHECDPKGSSKPKVVAEVVLDANRLTTFGHAEADTEVDRLIAEHGYTAVLKEAAKHVATW